MTQASQFLIDYGLWVVFVAVFLEQIGIPFPAPIIMLSAGALAAVGKFNLLWGMFLAVVACLLADGIWFYLGRYRGKHILGFLCRVSLEPDNCVRKTQNIFTKYGAKGIVAAKFIPGFSTMAPPMAGMTGMGIVPFLLADGLGSLIYGGCYFGLGLLFSNQIQQIDSAISHIGGSALALILALAALYVAFKFWRRQSFLRELRIARITPAELREMQSAGAEVVILDLRAAAEFEKDGSLILGAIRMGVDEVEHRHHEIPRDRDIIVYCSCPNEVTSARVALLLKRKGVQRVRPLLGGIDAWREQNYPMS